MPSHRVTVEETLHRLALAKVGTHNLRGILSLDVGIKDAVRFDNYAWPVPAKTVTMTAADVHLGVCHTLPLYLSLERLVDGT